MKRGVLCLFLLISVCWASIFIGCTLVAKDPVRVNDDLVSVVAGRLDSFRSLAKKYLGDPDKGWVIADFNNLEKPVPGHELIIPLKTVHLGGLYAGGIRLVPVLCYHGVTNGPPTRQKVSVSVFTSQMVYLKQNGFTFLGLDEFLSFLDFKIPIPPKPVLLTFDTTDAEFYLAAFTVLKKLKCKGVVFVTTDRVGSSGAMTWQQIRDVSKNGFHIGSQTRTGRNLGEIKPSETLKLHLKALKSEIKESAAAIETHVGTRPWVLAYPEGETTWLAETILENCGYKAGFTRSRGGNPFYIPTYRIRRSVIYGNYDMEKFRQNLTVFKKTDLQ